jgi:hypothetical protein
MLSSFFTTTLVNQGVTELNMSACESLLLTQSPEPGVYICQFCCLFNVDVLFATLSFSLSRPPSIATMPPTRVSSFLCTLTVSSSLWKTSLLPQYLPHQSTYLISQAGLICLWCLMVSFFISVMFFFWSFACFVRWFISSQYFSRTSDSHLFSQWHRVWIRCDFAPLHQRLVLH